MFISTGIPTQCTNILKFRMKDFRASKKSTGKQKYTRGHSKKWEIVGSFDGIENDKSLQKG